MNMKKALAVLLGAMMIFTFTACGEKKSGEASVKEHIYRAEEVKLDETEDKNSLGEMFIKGERMYLIYNLWDESGSSISIVNRNTDGSDSKKINIKFKQNQSMGNVTADDEGNYYGILNEYFEDNSDAENYIWENYFYLVKMDSQGNEIWKQELKSDNTDAEYYGVSWMDLSADGRIILFDTGGLTLFNTDGSLLKKVPLKQEISGETVIQLHDGTIVVNSYKSETNKYALNKINIDTGEVSEDYTVPGNSAGYSYYAGIGWDLLLMGQAGVYGYNLGDSEVTELMNLIDSDINTSYLYNIVAISDKEFYGIYSDNLTNEVMLAKYTKIDPADVVEKKVLTLGCYGMDWDVRTQVVVFNKSNQEYRIKIKDYSTHNTEKDYSAGIAKLNTDIASGNVPDILVLQNNMPVESYIAKGLFEDIYPYIEKDEEIKKDNFYPNILKAFDNDGKLYQVIPSFAIMTAAGKTADVGAKSGWTLNELNAVMAKKPADAKVFGDMTRSALLSNMIQLSGEQFINWETGECRFNSEAFIALLEFMKPFPEELESFYDNGDGMMRNYTSYETMYRENKVLLNMTYLTGYQDYNDAKKRIFGEDITLIGFPSEDRKGSAILPNLDLVISSKSGYKDGAWQFVRYFLTDEYQQKVSYGWPVNKKWAEKLAETAKKRPSYEDENGNIVEYDNVYNIDGVDIVITPMTQEDIDVVNEFVNSVDQVYFYNEELINIISEEAAPFFSGQKKVKDVADIIQSRVQIYVNENR